MRVLPIRSSLPGERVIGTFPPIEPNPDAGWQQRLRYYTGRTLNDIALTGEQDYRGGWLAALGSSFSPGVVTGLETGFVQQPQGGPLIQIAAGSGIATSGEDVYIPATVDIPLNGVPVVTGSGPFPAFSDWAVPASTAIRAGVLVLQPMEIGQIGEFDPDDQCENDLANFAFEDQRRVDGCRLLFVPWPESLGLLTPGVPFRNRLAWAIFSAELQSTEFPWLAAGVPIALAGFTATWALDFLDRNSVVRRGGLQRERTKPFPNPGSRFLHQARIEQFVEHASDPRLAVATPAALANQFMFMPPFGILPRETGMDETGTPANHFFPASWLVQATPIPVDQLDLAVSVSASLSGFDRDTPDVVEVLFPVPQEVYEPRLLVQEQVDPLFQQTLDTFIATRGQKLRKRLDMRNLSSAITQRMTGKPITFPDDPDALERDANGNSTEVVGPLPQPPDQDYKLGYSIGTDGNLVLDANGQPVILLQQWNDLVTQLGNQPLLAPEMPLLSGAAGLIGFIEEMQKKIDRSNDTVDFSFLRVNTNIYRIRNLMLNKSAASRLVTSTSLAWIAEQEESAADTRTMINDFLAQFKTTPTTPPTPTPAPAPAPTPGVGTTPIPGISLISREATPSVSTRAIESAAIRDIQFTPPGGAAALIKERVAKVSITDAASTGALFQPAVPAPSRGSVLEQAAIIGAQSELRNVTVAERLKPPSSQQSRDYASSARFDVISNLVDLPINKTGIEVTGITRNNQTVTLDQVDSTILSGILRNQFDTIDTATGALDEATFFLAGTRALDNTIATLRGIEGRIQVYRNAVASARKTLTDLQTLVDKVSAVLGVNARELAEARHDVSVTRSLLADEQNRVQGINDRRRKTIREHVQFLAFRRQRTADVLEQPAFRSVDPDIDDSPIPPCLGRQITLPPDLQSMIDVLRSAPVGWLVQGPRLLDRIDRFPLLLEALSVSKVNAVSELTFQPSANAPIAVQTAISAHRQVIQLNRAATAQVDVASAAAKNWINVREDAKSILSITDLIRIPKPDVGSNATREIAQIGSVAGCLYAAFTDVLPVLRLLWTERLSQFDIGFSLRNLSSLPRWQEVPFLQRREMQAFVDWLFGRVRADVPPAVAYMNDLVRVCLLLSSHSPVNQIIAGEVAKATPVKPGGRVKVTIDPKRVRIGMQVLMYSGPELVAHGTVEDLTASEATANIVKVVKENASLDKGARVQFTEAFASEMKFVL